jgi:hypothetical protein
VIGYQNYINVRKVKVYILSGQNFKFVAIPPETYSNSFSRGEETQGFLPESPAQHRSFPTNISTPQRQLDPYLQFIHNSATFQHTRAQQDRSNLPRDIQPPRIQDADDASNLEEMIEYSNSLLKHFSKLIEFQIKSKQSFNSGQPFAADQLQKTVKRLSNLTSKFQLPHPNNIQKISKKHKKLADLLASDEAKVYLFNLCQLCKVKMTSITLGCGHSICNSDLSNHIMSTYNIQRLPEEKYLLLARCNICDYNLTETELSKVLDRKQFSVLMDTLNSYKVNEQRYIAANKSYCGVCYQLKFNQEFGYVKNCYCRICRNCFMNNTSGYCILCNLQNHSQAYNPSFYGQQGQAPSSIQPIQLWQFPLDNIGSDIQTDQASKQGYYQHTSNQPIQDSQLKTSPAPNPLLAFQNVAKDPKATSSQSTLPKILENAKPQSTELNIPRPILAQPKLNPVNASERSTSVSKQQSAISQLDVSQIPQPIQKLANDLIQNISRNEIKRYDHATFFRQEERKVNCSICQNDFKLSEIVSLNNCEHKFCKEDLRRYTLASIENDQITKDGLKCPDTQCKHMVGDVIMENIFRDHDNEWTLYNRKVMGKRLKITYCPKCNAPIEYVNRIATCYVDGYQFCTLCNEDCHEGTCDQNSLIQRTKDMMQVNKVAQCPGCMIPYFKDGDNCDHVKCRNDSCGLEFCFDCACVRSPTLAHGNHYHRPQCKWFRPSPIPDQYLPNRCPACKNLGKLCPKPTDLKTKRILTGL